MTIGYPRWGATDGILFVLHMEMMTVPLWSNWYDPIQEYRDAGSNPVRGATINTPTNGG